MFGLVSFALDLPFATETRVGALVGDDAIIDLRLAYAAYLTLDEKDPHAHAIAAARIPSSMIDFIKGGSHSLEAAKAAAAFCQEAGRVPASWREAMIKPSGSVRLLPPLRPGKIICAGRNYWEHARESRMPLIDDFPRGFVKVNSTLLGPFDDLPYPSATKQLDYEVELAVIFGVAGRDIKPEDAYDHVFGYTIFNDVSARDWQYEERKKGNHLLGKNLDGTGPLGPAIIPKEFISDPHDVELELYVNGELRQNSSSSQMIFSIPQQIAHWSKMTLQPGDMLATGTPEGIAGASSKPSTQFLQVGDVVEASISGLGRLRNRVV